MEQGGTVVRLDSVSKRFDNGIWALENLSLTVGANEIVGLLGPSGCGKSTSLRLIAGLDTATSGTLDVPAARSGSGRIGFVFQEPNLMDWADARDNVALPLRLAGIGKKERHARAQVALAAVGLGGSESMVPAALSGGMKMRVSVARALMTDPELLLLDEPFAALDDITRFQLNDLVLTLREDRGYAALFVTHSLFEAAYLCDRVLVMAARPGRIVAEHRFARACVDATRRVRADFLHRISLLSQSLALASMEGTAPSSSKA